MAVEYVEHLSDFYRSIIAYREQDFISLREEMDLVRSFYFLLKMRYEEGLQFVERLDGQAGLVMPLALQLLVEVKDAAYFYTKDKLTFVVTRSQAKRFPVDHPLDKLEDMLDPAVFFRINRQFIINVTAIHALHPYSKSRVKVELEPSTDLETIVSTERSAAFKKWLVGEPG